MLAARADPALRILVEICAGSNPGATLAGVSDALLASGEGPFFSELIEQVLREPEIERETAESDLRAAIHMLRDRQIRAELDQLSRADASDPEAKVRMRKLMEEQQLLRSRMGAGASGER
jgi:hypothetical protein